MSTEITSFMKTLKCYRYALTAQEFRTLKGQAIVGDLEGARKGLNKILGRREA